MIIKTPKEAKNYIGQRLYWDDPDPSGRPQSILRSGILTDVHRRQLCFDDREYKYIGDFHMLTPTEHPEWE